ncbi:siderophore-interacting protein [Halomonas sp. MC140]|nr:siderophore-interacting protein [Halomonas sp. MC140]MDN7131146.1 siderophore-interacting protein [Halomonas sp. MC140]
MAAKQSYRIFDITLLRRTHVSASLVRFTFSGPDVSQMATYAPDQRIKLFFPEGDATLDPLFEIAKRAEHDWYSAYRALQDDQRPTARTYTIRALRPECAEVDVEFVLHGDTGPASRWATHARPGDRLAMTAPAADAEGPKLGYEWKPPQGVRRILIIADETALPAAAGILESLDDLPLKPRVEALFEVPLSDDVQSLPHATELRWLARDAEPGCQHGERLMRALHDIDLHQEIVALGGMPCTATATDSRVDERSEDEDEPLWEPAVVDNSAPLYVWIAAETKVAMRLRRYLINERGLPKKYVTSMGYWRLGKANG